MQAEVYSYLDTRVDSLVSSSGFEPASQFHTP